MSGVRRKKRRGGVVYIDRIRRVNKLDESTSGNSG